MALGFHADQDFSPVIGWELYQVTLDKYHVMFYFEGGCQLLNIANGFSHESVETALHYTYEIYGTRKRLEIDRLLRQRVVSVTIRSSDRLALSFSNNDVLVVHDDPAMTSWWFMPVENKFAPARWTGISDGDPDDAW
jgi:hypothetical protein